MARRIAAALISTLLASSAFIAATPAHAAAKPNGRCAQSKAYTAKRINNSLYICLPKKAGKWKWTRCKECRSWTERPPTVTRETCHKRTNRAVQLTG